MSAKLALEMDAGGAGGGDRSDDEDDDEITTTVKRRRGGEEDEGDDEDDQEDESSNDEGDDDDDDDADNENANENGGQDDEAMHLQRQRLGLLDDQDLENLSGESYLKKFDASLRFQMMQDFHPELLMENNQDVQAKTVIQRDEFDNIVDPYHRTLPILTKYERARILGERAKQLNAGARSTIDVPEHVIDGYLIAVAEFEAKKIPFIIKRPLRNGTCEYWKFSDLEVL